MHMQQEKEKLGQGFQMESREGEQIQEEEGETKTSKIFG